MTNQLTRKPKIETSVETQCWDLAMGSLALAHGDWQMQQECDYRQPEVVHHSNSPHPICYLDGPACRRVAAAVSHLSC